MKLPLILTLILSSIICFGQKQDVTAKANTVALGGTKEQVIPPENSHKTIAIPALTQLRISNAQAQLEKMKPSIEEAQRIIAEANRLSGIIENSRGVLIEAAGITWDRVTNNPDSLKISDKQIDLILKPKKK